MPASSIPDIVEEIRKGHPVIVIDDEGRENEGDLIVIAELVTPEHINFMSKHGRGLICLALSSERCKYLNLPLMVKETDFHKTTNFTVSIEACKGVTTGISAHDRSHTIRVATAADTQPGDITQPGHIFPLMEQPGGVLARAGHTEAGCDLARLAGFEPAAVIVEILNDDGSMARRPELETFAREHKLKICTVEDLIRYRIENGKTVVPSVSVPVKTQYGEFILHAYDDLANRVMHIALSRGNLHKDKPTLVRVHVENALYDAFGITAPQPRWSMESVMRYVSGQDCAAAIVLLRLPESGGEIRNCLAAIASKEQQQADGNDERERWTLGIGGQILNDLGVGKMRLMSTPQKFHGLGGFGLSVESYVERA